jgi:pyruvate/2-oxoglutarate dehydrogenase complex dihydrolipoamide acyltransferase (E2) component
MRRKKEASRTKAKTRAEVSKGGQQQQQPNATQAAEQKAQELGVDLSQVQGSGAEGRITVRDVIAASNQ